MCIVRNTLLLQAGLQVIQVENGSGHNVVAVFIVSLIDEDTLTVALVPLRPSYSWVASEVEMKAEVETGRWRGGGLW